MEGWIIMKIRQGFVSNSSSSSFIVSIKLDEGEMTKEELFAHNMKQYEICYGAPCDDEEREWREKEVKKFKNRKIIYYGSVEYGSEESVEAVVKGVLKGLGIDSKKIKMEFDE
jgi:hypothetical protein